MTTDATASITIEPIISYPREVEPGKTYLVSVDLRFAPDKQAWPYEEEEHEIYCLLKTTPFFTNEELGNARLVLHRFGGTYGPAMFLLTANQIEGDEPGGFITLTLANRQLVPLQVIELGNIRIRTSHTYRDNKHIESSRNNKYIGNNRVANIFIAVGGSGSKVAEALVRMLAAGFPTKIDPVTGIPTSAGDDLQIWRLDPDRSSGAAESLQRAADEYGFLLDNLRKGEAENHWAMEIERGQNGQALIRHLDPLALHEENQRVKTLRGILHSQGRARNERMARDSMPFLSLFYDPKELDVEIDRGFYQKPFIGAPVMAIFAETLKDANSAGGRQCQLSYLESQSVRFFLCGSLHGGTGACGVPVMSQFLAEHKKARQNHLDWQLGGCLLSPYCLPPEPPFDQLQEAQRLAGEQDEIGFHAMVEEYLRRYGQVAPFNNLSTVQDKRELVRQILLGFYARRTDMIERARNSLVYYKEHIASYFNALYLVGKPTPDSLPEWSNGGFTQQNPINSAEVSAALAALNFFSDAHDRENQAGTYVVGTSTRTLSDQMLLSDLPVYSLPTRKGPQLIDPEKVLLATAAMRHLVTHQLPWSAPAESWPPELKRLKEYYAAHPENEPDDRYFYPNALKVITNSIHELLSPLKTQGWNGQDYSQLNLLLSDEERARQTVTEKLQTRLMSREAKDSIVVGSSEVKVSKKEFPEWCPAGKEFSRGDYLREVWWNLLDGATSRRPAANA